MNTTDESIKKFRSFFRLQHRLPTYQEIADMFGFASKNAAFKLVTKLVDAGYLEKDEKGRLIPKRLFNPLLNAGVVAAGFPTPAEEDIESLTSLDEYLISRPEATFMLKVSGESMIEAGIQPNDTVLVEKGRQVKTGDIVIAQVDGEWTMKYYVKEGSGVILRPANKAFSDIRPKETLNIAGVVVSVIRKYH